MQLRKAIELIGQGKGKRLVEFLAEARCTPMSNPRIPQTARIEKPCITVERYESEGVKYKGVDLLAGNTFPPLSSLMKKFADGKYSNNDNNNELCCCQILFLVFLYDRYPERD